MLCRSVLGVVGAIGGLGVLCFDDHIRPILDAVRIARRAGRAQCGRTWCSRVIIPQRDFGYWTLTGQSAELERLLDLKGLVVLTGDYLSLQQAGRNFVQSIKYNHNFVVSNPVLPHDTKSLDEAVQTILGDLQVGSSNPSDNQSTKPCVQVLSNLSRQLKTYHSCKLVVVLDARQDFDVLFGIATDLSKGTCGTLVLVLARNIDVARSALQGKLSKSTMLVDTPIVTVKNLDGFKSRLFGQNPSTQGDLDKPTVVEDHHLSQKAFGNRVLQVGSGWWLPAKKHKTRDAIPSESLARPNQVSYGTLKACKAFCEQAPNWPDLVRELTSTNMLSIYDCMNTIGKHEFCELLKVASSTDFLDELFTFDMESRTFGFASLEAKTCFEALLRSGIK